ncbi:Syntaxin-like protein 1 [Elsinoe fawcettii]|nr:Syntaxin-like protein 1 [Elsinoe fawcettii]
MAQAEDPFLQVQSDLLSNLDSARPLFQSYLRIRSTASNASNPELREARTELGSVLQDLSADLTDLVESVKAVEKDHYRYGLEIEEVQRRRQLVQDVGNEVEEMHTELRATVEGSGKGGATGGDGLPHPSNFDSEDEGEDGYGRFEQQRQMEIMAEQDEALDGVFKTVGNLRAQADTMGRELEEQAELLDDVDNVADRVGGKLQTGIKKIGYVIKKNEDTYSSCCIALLIVMLIILLVIVIAL